MQVLVLLVTGGLLSMGVYGSINIVQRFDANKMLPADSYLSKWIAIQQEYYSGHGFAVSVNMEFCFKIMLPRASYPFPFICNKDSSHCIVSIIIISN